MTTAALRSAALLDPWAVLLPDGTIGDEDRVALLGQYPVQSLVPSLILTTRAGVADTVARVGSGDSVTRQGQRDSVRRRSGMG